MAEETKSVSARVPLNLIEYLDRRAELHKRQGKDTKTRSDQIVIAVQRMQLADLPPEQREEVFAKIRAKQVPPGPVVSQQDFSDLPGDQA